MIVSGPDKLLGDTYPALGMIDPRIHYGLMALSNWSERFPYRRILRGNGYGEASELSLYRANLVKKRRDVGWGKCTWASYVEMIHHCWKFKFSNEPISATGLQVQCQYSRRHVLWAVCITSALAIYKTNHSKFDLPWIFQFLAWCYTII